MTGFTAGQHLGLEPVQSAVERLDRAHGRHLRPRLQPARAHRADGTREYMPNENVRRALSQTVGDQMGMSGK